MVAMLGVAALVGVVLATPGQGVTSTLFAVGRFDDGIKELGA